MTISGCAFRQRLANFVRKTGAEHKQHLLTSPDTPWALQDLDQNLQAKLQGELVVAGIYIRLFVANPGWVLRKPREFLIELMERVLKEMASGKFVTLNQALGFFQRFLGRRI